MHFRALILLLFATPLLLMLVIYVRIFLAIKRHNQARQTMVSITTKSRLRSSTSTVISTSSRGPSKAIKTTLAILGTYLLCWMPAVLFLAVTCVDGCPFNLYAIPPVTKITVNFVINLLVCLKAIVDPFIYSIRIHEVRAAMARFCRCRTSSRARPNLDRKRSSTSATNCRNSTAITNYAATAL